jgi:hypothetical protein
MTTPGSDAFDYTDDSVIARVSFDIPPSTLTDISQITQAMGAMRTELESIARAQSDWLDYLSQVPQIAERANQAYRESITQMERMAYIQNEIGSGAPVGGGIGGGGEAGIAGGGGSAGGGGVAAYSTAAPSGYVNPFKDMVEGTGTAPSVSAITEQINEATQGDPRLAANMMAARGIAVNPALLGMAGAAATSAVMGDGKPAPQGGAGSTGGGGGMLGNAAAAAGTLASQAGLSNFGAAAGTVISQVGNEIRNGMGGTRIGQILGMGGGAGGGPPGGGPPGSGGSPGGGGGVGGFASGLLKMPLPIKVGGALAAGAYALNQAQNIGERVTQFQQLGSEEGGDYVTGMKNELTARVQALDPAINVEQSREAIQKPMSEGFKGEGRSDLRELLTSNFKELGVSMGDSMTIAMSNLRETSGSDADVKKVRSQEQATLNTMKEFAADGGASLSQRVAQQVESSINLNKLGLSQENIDRTSIGLQEGYGDSVALRGKRIGQIQGQTMNSSTLMATVGLRNGITGILPEAMPKALEEAGIDGDQAFEQAAAEIAKYASSQPIRLNRIAVFKRMMGEQGVELDMDEAEALYTKVTGGKDRKQPMPSKVADAAVARKGEKNHQTNWNPISYLKGILTAKPEDVVGEIMGDHAASQNAENTANNFVAAGRGPENFAPAGRRGQSLPQTASQTAPVVTQGQVSGNVTITVDKNGNVTAPAVIQLTGTQRAVNAGAGGAQLNNIQPGESHAANTFPGGR